VAEARLESRSRAVLGTQVGQVELSDLLRADGPDGSNDTEPAVLEQLADAVRRAISRADAGDTALPDRLGIEIVDLRINRLGFPAGNQQAIFERMRSERKKIADGYRSAGMAENKMIMSQADRQYGEILARAQADAERIRGEAEAESIAILNRAHARDPEFYRITRTLDAYREILGEKTTLVLSASNPWLKLLTDGIPETSAPALPGRGGLSADDGPARAENPEDSAVSARLPATAANLSPGVRQGERTPLDDGAETP
jgi:membrane protease subunit HflC